MVRLIYKSMGTLKRGTPLLFYGTLNLRWAGNGLSLCSTRYLHNCLVPIIRSRPMALVGRGNFPSVLSPPACPCEGDAPIPTEAWAPLITKGLTNVNMRPINGRSPTIFAQRGPTRSDR